MKEILLHVCCGPDATYSIERLKELGYNKIYTYFLNHNIHPLSEYKKRKEAYLTVANHYKVEIVEDDYIPDRWFRYVKGYENEPEKGKRCDLCYYYSLYHTAIMARRMGIPTFTTTLSISPHKPSKRVFAAGLRAAENIGMVTFLEEDFKKRDGFRKSIYISKELGLYRQNYCGCIFSRMESERRRKEKGHNNG